MRARQKNVAANRSLICPTGKKTATYENLSSPAHENIPLRVYPKSNLALQLPFLKISESMGNHDSKIAGAGRVG
jgi:hypothetical protein